MHVNVRKGRQNLRFQIARSISRELVRCFRGGDTGIRQTLQLNALHENTHITYMASKTVQRKRTLMQVNKSIVTVTSSFLITLTRSLTELPSVPGPTLLAAPLAAATREVFAVIMALRTNALVPADD